MLLLNWLQTIHFVYRLFQVRIHIAFTILLDYYIHACYIVTPIYDVIPVWWVFGKRTYRLEAALTRKAAWCRGLTRNHERRDRANSRMDTRRVLKTHRDDSVYVLRLSLAVYTFLRIAMRYVSGFYFGPFFPVIADRKFWITSFDYAILYYAELCRSYIWYRNYYITYAYAPQYFHRSRVLPFFSPRWQEEEMNERRTNVSETCFDSGDNKGPIETVRTLLCPPGHTCPTLNILKIFNRASELRKKRQAYE